MQLAATSIARVGKSGSVASTLHQCNAGRSYSSPPPPPSVRQPAKSRMMARPKAVRRDHGRRRVT
jgi:hypothetical protein